MILCSTYTGGPNTVTTPRPTTSRPRPTEPNQPTDPDKDPCTTKFGAVFQGTSMIASYVDIITRTGKNIEYIKNIE